MVAEDEIPEGLHDVTDHDHTCEDFESELWDDVEQSIAVSGHTLEHFNGDYTFVDLYNDRPHFQNEANGTHIYYEEAESLADSFWHLDD